MNSTYYLGDLTGELGDLAFFPNVTTVFLKRTERSASTLGVEVATFKHENTIIVFIWVEPSNQIATFTLASFLVTDGVFFNFMLLKSSTLMHILDALDCDNDCSLLLDGMDVILLRFCNTGRA